MPHLKTQPTYADRYDSIHSARWSPKKSAPAVPDGCAWGRITCVPADHVPDQPTMRVPWGFWQSLIDDVFLRLECTPRSEKLHVPFASIQLAQRAYHTLRNRIDTQNRDVEIEPAYYEKVPALYIRRGATWGKNTKVDPELESLPE